MVAVQLIDDVLLLLCNSSVRLGPTLVAHHSATEGFRGDNPSNEILRCSSWGLLLLRRISFRRSRGSERSDPSNEPRIQCWFSTVHSNWFSIYSGVGCGLFFIVRASIAEYTFAPTQFDTRRLRQNRCA